MGLTAAGAAFLAQAITGQGVLFDSANAAVGVGNGLDAFEASQTDLTGTEKIRKGVDVGYPVVNAPTVNYRATFAQDEANFAWNEWGIFNSTTGGVMLNRALESNGTKQSNQTWVLDVSITFSIE